MHAVWTTKTMDFARNRGTFVAITANTGAAVSTTESVCGTPDGLLVSDTDPDEPLVNWPQTSGPVLYFTSNSSATITDGQLPELSQIQNAVAGSTSQDSDCSTCLAGGITVQDLGTLDHSRLRAADEGLQRL